MSILCSVFRCSLRYMFVLAVMPQQSIALADLDEPHDTLSSNIIGIHNASFAATSYPETIYDQEEADNSLHPSVCLSSSYNQELLPIATFLDQLPVFDHPPLPQELAIDAYHRLLDLHALIRQADKIKPQQVLPK